MGTIVKTAPAVEPITLAEAKAHLRVDIDDDDALIQNAIRVARFNLERVYRIAIISQTLQLFLDYFGHPDLQYNLWGNPNSYAWWNYAGSSLIQQWTPIEVRWPLVSVNSILYYDTTQTQQTVPTANYIVDSNGNPPRVAPTPGKLWPATGVRPSAVTIETVNGFATPALVPEDIKGALKLIVGNLYENREQSIIGTRLVAVDLPYGVAELMAPYQTYLVR